MTITLEQAYQIAVSQFDTGQLAAAEASFRRIVALQPNHGGAWHRLGLIAMSTGRPAEAVAAIQRAISQPGATPMQVSDLGVAYWNCGRRDMAAACFQRALEMQPGLADVHYNLGNVLESLGRPDDAIACYERTLALQPGYTAAHNNFGNVLVKQGRFEEAIASYQRALALQPNFPEAMSNLGDALTKAGREDEAIALLRRTVAMKPDFAEAHNNLGSALWKKKLRDEATVCYRRALELSPNYAEAHSNLGGSFMALDRHDDAIACYERAAALKPDLPDAYGNMGVACMRQGHNERALELVRQAVACDPRFADGHWNLALILFLLGRWEEGWREHEWRWRTPVPVSPLRHFSQPQWDGAPLPDRTLLLHAEQGFGDTIQFMRYAPLSRERSQAARVIVEVPPPLVRLLTQSVEQGIEIVGREAWDASALPPFDAHLPLLSQPLALREYPPLRISAPYLRADETSRAAWRDRLPAGFRVGLVWAGKPDHTNDHHRSIAFDRLLPLLRVPDVHFISLQIDTPLPQREGVMLHDLTAHLADFADTAALIAELDLVISVDTAVAHLAGALGARVWTLLPFAPDWRWGTTSEETPWYPTMRLFRQRQFGDWDEVIARVAAELSTLRP